MNRTSKELLAAIAGVCIGLATLAVVVLVLRGSGDSEPAPAPPVAPSTTSTREETPPPAEPAATTDSIPVGRSPNAVAAGFDSIWVLRDGRRIVRIDQTSGRVVARVGVGERVGGVRPCGITTGAGGVWATTTNGNLARANPDTNRLAGLIEIGDAACVATGAGAVWVTSPTRGILSRVDPETNDVAAEISVGSFPQGVATGAGSVWVASSDPPAGANGSVSRIAPESNEVMATIPVASLPEYLVAAAGSVWVTGNDGTVRRIDPETNELTVPPVRVAAGGRTTLAVGGGWIWATTIQGAGSPGAVVRVDPKTRQVGDTTVTVGESPLGMAFAGGALWVANYNDGTVTRLRP